MQCLGHARLDAPFAGTHRLPPRATEDLQKVRRQLVVPHLDRPGADRPAVELFRNPGRLRDRIEQHLRRDRLPVGVRVVLVIGGVGSLDARGELIDLRLDQRAGDGPQVVLLVDQMLRERIEQRFIRCRVGRPQIIDRLDQPPPHVMRPEPVHDRAGKIQVVLVRHPVRQCPSAGRRLTQNRSRGTQSRSGDDLLAAGMLQVGPLLVDDLQSTRRDRAAVDSGEEPGQGHVVPLVPALERVVMALGTLDADAEEQLADRAGQLLGILLDLIEPGGGLGQRGPLDSQDRPHELVIGDVAFDLPPNPASHRHGPLRRDDIFVDLQQVAPPQSPVVGILGTLEE